MVKLPKLTITNKLTLYNSWAFPNDNTIASGNYTTSAKLFSKVACVGPSGGTYPAIGWIKCSVGDITGYLAIYSGACVGK